MSKDKGRNSRQDNRGNNSGYNYLLYAMVLGLVVVFGLMYFTNIAVDEIAYEDLLQLIEATKYESKIESSPLVEGNSGTIYVLQSADLTYEYSRLRGIVVGPRSITGEVNRRAKKSDERTSPEKTRRFRTNIGDDETTAQELSTALKGRNIDWHHSPPPSMWRAWTPMFLISGLFILLFVMMLRRLGGAGSPMAFGRSRGRLYAQEDLGVTFDDAAGIDEAVEEVKEVVDFLKSAEKYQRLGARIP